MISNTNRGKSFLGISSDGWAAMLFLLPSLTGFLAFIFLPITASLALAFCKWDVISGLEGIHWIGLKNFRQILGFIFDRQTGELLANDPLFWKYLYNTLFLMCGIPFGIAGSLIIALMLNSRIPMTRVLRTVYYLPSICVPVAVFLLWRWLLNNRYGVINYMLGFAGITGPDWLGTITWAKPAIIIASFWMGVGGGGMILYLAGLQGIPRELYEAADIDGAGRWQKFRMITWPLLTPTTFFIFITSVIGGFQGGFEAAYMMTGGGPAGSTMTISYYIYQYAFTWFRMGYASALSWILFIIIFVVTVINWKYGGRRVHYF
ncbi:MAG: sugar ABC transporter permease [bacterium]|nr:sugar ABC transporter permease [Candidatus Sumerlaeota bacterium]